MNATATKPGGLHLEAALDGLGDDAAGVARTLRKAGIRGSRINKDCCPVANYLAAKFPGHRFEVGVCRVQIDGEGRVVTPQAVASFVLRFDEGGFPELEEGK
jgi:hypothetical protein